MGKCKWPTDNFNNRGGLLSNELLIQLIFTFKQWLKSKAFFRRRRALLHPYQPPLFCFASHKSHSSLLHYYLSKLKNIFFKYFEYLNVFMIFWRLQSSNVLGVRSFADQYMCGSLVEACNKFINKHFSEVIATDEFVALDKEEVLNILSRDELHVTSEEQVNNYIWRIATQILFGCWFDVENLWHIQI